MLFDNLGSTIRFAARHRSRFMLSLLTIVFVISSVLFIYTPDVRASGGVGGGGSGSNSGSGYNTRNGWGWRLYSVDGSGPSGGFYNGSWGDAQAACQVGSLNVVVFVVLNPSGGQMGFDYKSSWDALPNQRSNPRPWVTTNEARAKYNEIPDPGSYVFGDNVSWMCWGDNPGWTSSGTTSANRTTAAPGQTITWTHTIRNDGPSSTNKAITPTVVRSGVNPGTSSVPTRAAGVPSGGNVTSTTRSYTPAAADAGRTICERIQWTPISNASNATQSSNQVCVTISFSYQLSPTISIGQTTISNGDEISGIGATISNGGPTASQGNSSTAVVRFVVPRSGGVILRPNASATVLTNNTNAGCKIAAVVASGITSCSVGLHDNATGQAFPNGVTSLINGATDSGLSGVSLNSGDKVCYITVVSKYSAIANNLDWRHSGPACATVAKTPSVQIWGNDLRVGSTLNGGYTGNSMIAGRVSGFKPAAGTLKHYGSWAEYGIFAPGRVNAVASSAGLFDGADSPQPISWSNLTFANADSSNLGYFADPSAMGSIPDIKSYFITKSSPLVQLANGNVTISNTSSIKPADLIVPGGKVLILNNPNNTVTIADDIVIPSGSTANDMRQVVIIADNINIIGNVTRVDAWLIATNRINTCSDVNINASLTDSMCDKHLDINGAVTSPSLYLRRTAGGEGPAITTSAETINLRADAYIWANNLSRKNGSLTTTSVTELPPRY